MKEHRVIRQKLLEGRLISVQHLAVHPVSSACGDIEVQETNVLALPLSGVFAKHDGPRRHVLATANDALFIRAGSLYRLSFPGCIGDQCITLRFSTEAFAHCFPQVVKLDGINPRLFAIGVLMPSIGLLTRHLLWQRFSAGELDDLELEEVSLNLLGSALSAAQDASHRADRLESSVCQAARSRQIENVKEAMSVSPERKWTLGDLASLAKVSPYHLAHVFRRDAGISVFQYLLRTRLAAALARMMAGETDLSRVALDVGFASHSHFTSRFRRCFGMTPLELRRKANAIRVTELRKIVIAQTTVSA